MGWQSIETAPRDGRYILAYDITVANQEWRDEETYLLVQWDGHGWRIALDGQEAHPTHWMPLPEPPQPQGAD